MKVKYYPPDIEEFHVGFEYEHQQDMYDGEESYRSNCYIPFTIGINDLKYVKAWVEDDRVRVKYLDLDDIRDLGFEKEAEDKFFMTLRKYLGDEHYLELHVLKETPGYYLYIGESDMDNLGYEDAKFEGIVKNKSELKKILKQIGDYDK